MTPDPWLSALHHALQGPPGIETWDALCVVLNEAPDEGVLRRALPDALAALQHWPEDVVRLAPASWVAPISPALQLANALRVSGFDLSADHVENTAWFVRLMRAPELRGLCALTVILIHDVALALARATHLTSLTSLALHSCDIDMDGLRALVCAPHLRGLNELALSMELGEEGASVLAKAHLPRLKTLNLANSQLGAAGMEALATASWLAHVKHLDLSFTQLGDRGAIALAAAPELSCLSDLMLDGNELGDAGACALAKSTSLVELVRLNLCDNEVRDLGAKALADSPLLAKLVELDLGFNPVGDEGALAFAEARTRTSLAVLSFWGAGVYQAETVVALLTSPHLPQLRVLHLLGMGLAMDVECARALVAAPHAPSLETLNASFCKLTDECAVVLAQWRGLEHLVSLDLSHNAIGDVGIAALLASPYLRELVSLDVSSNAIGDAGAVALAAARLPRLRTIKLKGS